MTCIAAVAHHGRVTMGADSALTYPNFDIMTVTDGKIFPLMRGEVYVGCCGSPRMRDLLQYQLELPKIPRKADLRRWMVREFVHRMRLTCRQGGLTRVKHETEDFDGALLVAVRGQIFTIECDFQVGESDVAYAAIGSGGSLAQGSLYSTARLTTMAPQARVLEALECAERFNAAVRRPFKLVQV